MRAILATGLTLLGVTLALIGCAAPPPTVYQRQIQIRDLAADVSPVDNTFQIIAPEQTVGRFACSLAIAKLVPTGPAGEMKLVQLTPAEEAYWTDTVHGVVAVRDLQFLTPISVRPEEPGTDTLCAAARDRAASLLLLYAPNRYGPNSAQVFGVLYDTQACQPVATLHASARFLNEEGEEAALDGEPGDHRDADACFQAARTHERHLRECLAALIHDDSPALPTKPHRWDTPREERWWVP